MNCPKCGSPINPGDRFCQVCGSAIETNNAQPQESVPVQPEVVQQAPVQNVEPVQQPVPAPMPTPMPTPAPVAEEPKKGNNLVIILVAVIAILVVAIVAILFLGNGNKESSSEKNSGGSAVAKNDGPKYNEVTVDKYKLKLMDGYSATMEDGIVYLYNTAQSVVGSVQAMEGVSLSDVDPIGTAANLTSKGFECTYKELTIEGKKALIFTGTYDSLDLEVIYIQESAGVVTGGTVQYLTNSEYTKEVENVHKMYAMISVSGTSTNMKTSSNNLFGQVTNK